MTNCVPTAAELPHCQQRGSVERQVLHILAAVNGLSTEHWHALTPFNGLVLAY